MQFPPYRLPEISPDNFGDGLNDFLWACLGVPSHEACAFFGVGTILCEHYFSCAFRRYSHAICYGSGVGLGSLPNISHIQNTSFVFLRGPLTAKALGLDASLAITDPVSIISEKNFLEILLSRIAKSFPCADAKFFDVPLITVVPHYANPAAAAIKAACECNGFLYLDIRSHPLEVISAIQSSSLVVCEAMHAAIVADSLGVPWVPFVRSHSLARQFKWHDWCLSIGLEYHPHVQPYLDMYDFATRRRNSVRKGDVSHLFVRTSPLSSALNIASSLSSKVANVFCSDRLPGCIVKPEIIRGYSEFLRNAACSRPFLSSDCHRKRNAGRIIDACARVR